MNRMPLKKARAVAKTDEFDLYISGSCGLLQLNQNGCFLPKPGDLRQDLCVKSPFWSCWEASEAMQLMGPLVKLINLESTVITPGSQPKINMVLCPPLWKPLSICLTGGQSSPELNPIRAFSHQLSMQLFWERKTCFLFLSTLSTLPVFLFFFSGLKHLLSCTIHLLASFFKQYHKLLCNCFLTIIYKMSDAS